MKTLPKVFLVVATIATFPMVVNADIAWTGAANDGGNVLTDGNWDGGTVPGASDRAQIGDAPEAVLSGSWAPQYLDIGTTAGKTGTLTVGSVGELSVTTVSDGATVADGSVRMGAAAGAAGVLNIDGGTMTVYSLNTPNYAATSTVNMVSGTLNATGWVDWGRNANGLATINQSGGTVNVGKNLWIGRDNSGTGIYNMSGGTLNQHTTGSFALGYKAGTTGRFSMGGGCSVSAVLIEVGSTGHGEFTQSGGSVVVPTSDIRIGINAAGSGTYTLDNGTVRPKYWLIVGYKGLGSFEQNDGIVTLVDGDNNNGNWLSIGRYSGSSGTYVMNGGEIEVATGERGGGIFAGHEGTGRFELNGGTVTTPTITKKNGTSTVVLNGGTIKVAKDGGTASSNQASDIGILKNIDRLVFGRGTTIDTNGHDTKIVGCGHDTIAGSSLVKTGTGTLTVETLPPVETLIVSNGTLAVDSDASSYTPAIAPALAHRWSFTSDYTDSVTGDAAVQIGSNVALSDGKVTMSGTGHGAGSLNLGTNLLDTATATIEVWARHDAVQKWARVFDYGPDDTHYFTMAWTHGTNAGRHRVDSKYGDSKLEVYVDDTTQPYVPGTEYYIVATLEKSGDATIAKWQRRNVTTGETLLTGTFTIPAGVHTFTDPVLYLGHSQFTSDFDANATYDEVRVWNYVLSDEAIAESCALGPDATTAQLANLVKPATIEVASGATLDLGGNSAVAGGISGAGTLQNGTLTVTKSLKLTAGQTLTVASGATLDLTGVTDVSITNPGDLPAGGWTFATSSSGGIPAAEPIRLSGDLAGYYLYLKGNKATIGKPGFMIIVR